MPLGRLVSSPVGCASPVFLHGSRPFHTVLPPWDFPGATGILNRNLGPVKAPPSPRLSLVYFSAIAPPIMKTTRNISRLVTQNQTQNMCRVWSMCQSLLSLHRDLDIGLPEGRIQAHFSATVAIPASRFDDLFHDLKDQLCSLFRLLRLALPVSASCFSRLHSVEIL